MKLAPFIVSQVSRIHAVTNGLKRSGELLNFLWVLHLTVVDVWFTLRHGEMEFL